MSLSPPAIVGPVSECSTAVQVMGQSPGSRVRIYIDDEPGSIGDAVVDWADAYVAIDDSRLSPNQRLRATQEDVGGQEGERAPAGELVEEAINGKVHLPDPIVECTQALHVWGCSPGARLEVRQGGSLLGSLTAVGDDVAITFDPGKSVEFGSASGVEVRQRICTSPTPVSTVSRRPVRPSQATLAAPTIIEPLERCVEMIKVAGIIPGAVLRLRRDGTTIFDAPIAYDTVNVRVPALRIGERFEAEQALPQCEYNGHVTSADVVELSDLLPPRLDGPTCPSPHKMTVSRLKPGATVVLLANDNEIGRWTAGDESMPVDVNPPAGATLTVRQELCDKVSPPSRRYPVTSGRSGRWFRVEDAKGGNLMAHSFAIHAALARTGKIVIFSGDQHNRAQHVANPQDINHCELFDCTTYSLRKIDAPSTDVFCAGHAFLPDGRLLAAGGTEKWVEDAAQPHGAHFSGLSTAWIFDPLPDEEGRHWSRGESMAGGRWYPTLLTLSSGDILALSGHTNEEDTARHQNNSMETWTSQPWHDHGETPDIDTRNTPPPSGELPYAEYLYPRIFSGPSGEVFSATPVNWEPGDDERIPRRSASWTPGSGVAWKRNSRPPQSVTSWGLYSEFAAPGALLPLLEEEEFRFQVLRAGEAGSDSGWIIDLGTPDSPSSNPTWQRLTDRSSQANGRARINSNLVLLPSGEVLLCGGVEDPANDDTAVHAPEMLIRTDSGWQWDQGQFAQARISRNYHSTALLMPDGRVFTGGGNINRQMGGDNVRRLELEIYEPWYACRPRPRILLAPKSARPGSTLVVDVRGTEPITQIALVRCASVTHAFNPDQRYLGLIAQSTTPGRYTARVPAQAVAVPGYYLLFVCTQDGVPSKGVFIRIDAED